MYAIYINSIKGKKIQNIINSEEQLERCKLKLGNPNEKVAVYFGEDSKDEFKNPYLPEFEMLLRDINQGYIKHVICLKLFIYWIL